MREGSKSGQKVRQTRATWECARLVKEERASVTAHAALLTTPGVVPPRRKAECLGGECSRTRHFPLSPRLLSSLGRSESFSLKKRKKKKRKKKGNDPPFETNLSPYVFTIPAALHPHHPPNRRILRIIFRINPFETYRYQLINFKPWCNGASNRVNKYESNGGICRSSRMRKEARDDGGEARLATK